MTTYTIDRYTKDAMDRLMNHVYGDIVSSHRMETDGNGILEDADAICAWLDKTGMGEAECVSPNAGTDDEYCPCPSHKDGFISRLEHHKQYAQDNGIN